MSTVFETGHPKNVANILKLNQIIAKQEDAKDPLKSQESLQKDVKAIADEIQSILVNTKINGTDVLASAVSSFGSGGSGRIGPDADISGHLGIVQAATRDLRRLSMARLSDLGELPEGVRQGTFRALPVEQLRHYGLARWRPTGDRLFRGLCFCALPVQGTRDHFRSGPRGHDDPSSDGVLATLSAHQRSWLV